MFYEHVIFWQHEVRWDRGQSGYPLVVYQCCIHGRGVQAVSSLCSEMEWEERSGELVGAPWRSKDGGAPEGGKHIMLNLFYENQKNISIFFSSLSTDCSVANYLNDLWCVQQRCRQLVLTGCNNCCLLSITWQSTTNHGTRGMTYRRSDHHTDMMHGIKILPRWRTCLSCKVSTDVTDEVTTKGARASADMVLTWISHLNLRFIVTNVKSLI